MKDLIVCGVCLFTAGLLLGKAASMYEAEKRHEDFENEAIKQNNKLVKENYTLKEKLEALKIN